VPSLRISCQTYPIGKSYLTVLSLENNGNVPLHDLVLRFECPPQTRVEQVYGPVSSTTSRTADKDYIELRLLMAMAVGCAMQIALQSDKCPERIHYQYHEKKGAIEVEPPRQWPQQS